MKQDAIALSMVVTDIVKLERTVDDIKDAAKMVTAAIFVLTDSNDPSANAAAASLDVAREKLFEAIGAAEFYRNSFAEKKVKELLNAKS